jgi:hypothetical protein
MIGKDKIKSGLWQCVLAALLKSIDQDGKATVHELIN